MKKERQFTVRYTVALIDKSNYDKVWAFSQAEANNKFIESYKKSYGELMAKNIRVHQNKKSAIVVADKE